MRRKLAGLLRNDFTAEMAGMLGIESLADRDEAWRRLSLHPPPPGHTNDEQSAPRLRRKTRDQVFSVEPPTVASSSGSGGGSRLSDIANAALLGTSRGTNPGTNPGSHPGANPNSTPGFAGGPNTQPGFDPVTGFAPVAPQQPAAAHSKLLLVGLVIVGLLAIAAIVMSLQNRPAPVQEAQRFRIVEQPSEPVQPATPPQPAAPPPEVVEAVEAPAPAVVPTEAAKVRDRDPKPPRPLGPDAGALTRALRSQQPKIEACFRDHAVSLQGQPRMQVEISLHADGSLDHADIAPPSLAATPLGSCIARVARGTKFPAQGEPVSFAIPVTASQVP